MRPPHVSRWLALALAGVVATLIGARPALKAGPPQAAFASVAVGGAFAPSPPAFLESPAKVYLAAPPMSREAAKTHAKLQEKVGMNFPAATPLDDIKKYVEEVTADKDDPNSGVPFYFDPASLQECDVTMSSPVVLAFKKPVPLSTSLRLVLAQLRLRYQIQEDGIVVVTSEDSESAPADPGPLILNNLAELRAEVDGLRDEIRLLRRGDPASPGPIRGSAPMGGSVGGPMPGPGNPGGGFR